VIRAPEECINKKGNSKNSTLCDAEEANSSITCYLQVFVLEDIKKKQCYKPWLNDLHLWGEEEGK